MSSKTTQNTTAVNAGQSIASIIDCCRNFLKDGKFDECVSIVKNELETYISKLVKFLDDLVDTAAKKTMYLLRSYFRTISNLADAGPAVKSSLEEHFTSLQEYATDAEKMIGKTV